MDRSERRRLLLFALACVALGGMAIWLALRGPTHPPGGEDAAAKAPVPGALSAAERRRLRRRETELRDAGEDVHGDALTPPPGLERAGRRFLAFYLPYEVGRVSRATAAGLRATARPEFAGELLREAPRVPPGLGSAPPEAKLLHLDAFALSGRPGAGQVVARLRRSGDPEAAAFELHRYGGGWLVTGVAG